MGDIRSRLKPLDTDGTDLLGRQALIRRVASVLKSDSASPQTILLDGKWGSGKTSILNLALATFSREESSSILVLDACTYQDADELTARLIRGLAKHLDKPVVNNIQRTLSFAEDANGLLKLLSPRLATAVELLLDLAKTLISTETASADPSIEDALASVGAELTREAKPLRLVIENLDRLGHAEITMLLRSVGALLSLPYITVLISAEQKHLVDALDSTGFANGLEYIEKYFDYSIYVPLPSQREIEESFLDASLSVPGSPERSYARTAIQEVFPGRVVTLRLAYKLAISMQMSADGMMDDQLPLYNWFDLLHFEILRNLYPEDFHAFIKA